VDRLLLAIPFGVVAGLLWMVRRRRATWNVLTPGEKLGYALGLFTVQFVATVAASTVMWLAQPDYGASLRGSSTAPDGRTGYIYAGGFWACTYDVYAAKGFLTTAPVYHLERRSCSTQPTIRWNDDGSITLLDEKGDPMKREKSSW
jgi:hypothetical protein